MPPHALIPDPFPGKGPIPCGNPSFYEREEDFANILTILRAGDSVSLVGERKAGKTSFLNYLLAYLPADEFIPVFVDAQRVAPRQDGLFLRQLVTKARDAIVRVVAIDGNTLNLASTNRPEDIYAAFIADLDTLRGVLSPGPNGQKRRLVWLVDEIETLRGYQHTELFTFLRPLAQSDPDFRMLVAGYDVLYMLARKSKWSPFYSAFRHVRLEGLNPVVARQLVDDALARMEATIAPDLYTPMLNWTGQKPFFLKWVLSKLAAVLNQQQLQHIDDNILTEAQHYFLAEHDLRMHFRHLWETHPSASQQTVLSLIALQSGPYTHPEILNSLKERRLLTGDQQASRQLSDDLTRLEELGFLYRQVGNYTFTSGCLQAWINQNKPL